MSGNWVDAAPIEAFSDGDVVCVVVAGKHIALYKVEGAFFATSSICTHQQISLCDGFLEGYEIECPMHQGRFDIRNGRALCAPVTTDLPVYSTKVEAGQILVEIPPA